MNIDDADLGEGMKIEKILIAGDELPANKYRIDATNMSVAYKAADA